MNTETASSIEQEKKSQPRWQLIETPQGKEFQSISFCLYALCGLVFIGRGLTDLVERGLIVATISFFAYLAYSLRKR